MPRGPRREYTGRYADRLRVESAEYSKAEAVARRKRDKLIGTILAAIDEDDAAITGVADLTGYTREYLSRELPKWRAKASGPGPASRTDHPH